MRLTTPVAGLVASLCLGAVAVAQSPPQRLQGRVVSVTADDVTLQTPDGAKTRVALAPDWSISVSEKTTITAIKPGSFIGTTNVDVPGGGKAVEVHVFPPGVKLGEGQRVMNPATSTMMTNGTVRAATRMTNGGVDTVKADQQGLEIDVAFPGGTRHVLVPRDALITTMTPVSRQMLRSGILVTLGATAGPDGKPVARFITTGPDGAAPAR